MSAPGDGLAVVRRTTDGRAEIGVGLAVAYVALSAAKAEFVHQLLTGMSAGTALFYTFATTAFVFHTVRGLRRLLRDTYVKAFRSRRLVLALNLLTAASWYTYFLAIQNISPSTHTVLANAPQPLWAAALACAVPNRDPRRRNAILVGFLVILVAMALEFARMYDGGAIQIPSSPVVRGVGFALLCGGTLATQRRVTYQLQRDGFCAEELMTVRLFGLLALSLALSRHEVVATSDDPAKLLTLALVGLFGVAVPLFALQSAQSRAPELIVSTVVSFMPIAMLTAEFAFSGTIQTGSFAPAALAACGSAIVAWNLSAGGRA